MSALVVFSYVGTDVRTVTRGGEPWFVAKDVLAILELDHTSLRRLDDDEKGWDSIPTPGGEQEMFVINEPGLYSLVLGSRKPEAKAFKRFITHEVLPQIRQTGGYTPVVAAPAELTRVEILRMALDSETRALAAEATVTELTPRADAWDELAAADGDYEVADAAKILARAGIETGRQRLFAQLEDFGWIYRGSLGKWTARQTAVDAGYLAEKPQSHHHPRTGALVLDPPQVRVTVRGLERLRVRLGSLEERPNLRAVSA